MYISHLDLMRLWERALRRAGIPVAYSEGFNPRPRLSFASPLAVGTTSESELLDILLAQRISTEHFVSSMSRQLPGGIDIHQVWEVGIKVPSLQSQVAIAEYTVIASTHRSTDEAKSAVQDFLNLDHMEWEHVRDKKTRQYDIRTLVKNITLSECRDSRCTLQMTLKMGARPEQVALALGFKHHPDLIHRTNIALNSDTGKG
jgi:radical SAM-linked protein